MADKPVYYTIYIAILLVLAALYTLTTAYNNTIHAYNVNSTCLAAAPTIHEENESAPPLAPVKAKVTIYVNGRKVYTGRDPITINMALLLWHIIIGTGETTYVYTFDGSRVDLYCAVYAASVDILLGNDTDTTYSFTRVNMSIAAQLTVTQVYINNNTVYLYTGIILNETLNVTSIGLSLDIYHTCWSNTWYHAGQILVAYDPLSQPLSLQPSDNLTIVYALIFPDSLSAQAFYKLLGGATAILRGTTLEVHTFDPLTNTTCTFTITNFNTKMFDEPDYVKIVGLGYTQSTCDGYVMHILFLKSYWYKSGTNWLVSSTKLITLNVTVSKVGFYTHSGEPFSVAFEFRIPKPSG